MEPSAPDNAPVATIDLLGLLWAADHALEVASKRMHAKLGVTGRQRVAIRLVGREPGITPAKLADGLHIDPSTLTGILFRLEQAGLLRRERHPTDRRSSMLFLTGAGEAIEAVQSGTIEARLREVLRGVSPEAVAGFAQVLSALTIALQEEAP